MTKFGKKSGTKTLPSELDNMPSRSNSETSGNTFDELWDSTSSSSYKQQELNAAAKRYSSSTNSNSSSGADQQYDGPIDVDDMRPWREPKGAISSSDGSGGEGAEVQNKNTKKKGTGFHKTFLDTVRRDAQHHGDHNGTERGAEVDGTNNGGRRTKSKAHPESHRETDDHNNSSKEHKSSKKKKKSRRKKKEADDDFYNMPSLLTKSQQSNMAAGDSADDESGGSLTNDDLFQSLKNVDDSHDMSSSWTKQNNFSNRLDANDVDVGEEKVDIDDGRDKAFLERKENNMSKLSRNNLAAASSAFTPFHDENNGKNEPRRPKRENAKKKDTKKDAPVPFPILEITTEEQSLHEQVLSPYSSKPAPDPPPPSREKQIYDEDSKYDKMQELRLENMKLKQQIDSMKSKKPEGGGTDSVSSSKEAIKALGETAVRQRKVITEQKEKIRKLKKELAENKSSGKGFDSLGSSKTSSKRELRRHDRHDRHDRHGHDHHNLDRQDRHEQRAVKSKYGVSGTELEIIQSKSEQKTLNAEVDGLQRELARALETIEDMELSYQADKAKFKSLSETLASERMEADRLMEEDLAKSEQIDRFEDDLMKKSEEILRLREEVSLKHEVLIDIEKEKEREKKTSDIRSAALARELEELRDEVESLKDENQTLLASLESKPKSSSLSKMFALSSVQEGDEDEDDESVISRVLDGLTEENRSLKETNEGLRNSICSNVTQGEEIKERLQLVITENKMLSDENESLHKKIEMAKEGAAVEIAVAEEVANEERSRAADLERKLNKLIDEEQRLLHKNQDLERAITSADASKESEIMSMSTEKQILEEENKKLKSAVSSAESDLDTVVKKYADSMKELEKQVELLSLKNHQLSEENEFLLNDTDGTKSMALEEAAAAKEEASKERESANDLNIKLDELADKNRRLHENNRELETEVSSVALQKEAMSAEYAVAKKEWEQQSKKLASENQRLLDENETLREDMSMTKKMATEEVEFAKNAADKESSNNADLNRKLNELAIENQQLQKHNRELETAVSSAASQEKNTAMKHEVSKREWEQQSKELMAENRRLLDENETLREDNEAAKVGAATVGVLKATSLAADGLSSRRSANEESSNIAELGKKLDEITKEKEKLEEENLKLQTAMSLAAESKDAQPVVIAATSDKAAPPPVDKTNGDNDLQKQLDEVREEERRAVLVEMEGELNDAKNKNKELEDAVSSLEKENSKLKSVMAVSGATSSTAKVAAATSGKTESADDTQIEKLRERGTILEARIEELELENLRLANAVAAANADVSTPGQRTSENAQFDQAALLSAAKQQEDASARAKNAWRRGYWGARSFAALGTAASGTNLTEEEILRHEMELKIENLEENARTDKATIQKLRSDLVKVNSCYKEESYITKKRLENLLHENTAYAIKVKVLEKEFRELNTTKNEGGEMRDISEAPDGQERGNEGEVEGAAAAGQDRVSSPQNMGSMSLKRQVEALEGERDVLMSQVESSRKEVEELQRETEIKNAPGRVVRKVNESDAAYIARLEESCAKYDRTISSLKSELSHHRMTTKAESFRNELELEKVKEENRVVSMKLARLDKNTSNDASSQEDGRVSIVQLDAGYVNELRSNLALTKTAIVQLEEKLHASQEREEYLQNEIDRLNSERGQLASSIDKQLATVKDERCALEEDETKPQSMEKIEESMQLEDELPGTTETERKTVRMDADLAPDHPWRRKGHSAGLDSYSPSASEVELALSFEEESDEEPLPEDVPYTFSSNMRDSISSLAFHQRKGEISNLEDKIFEIAMKKK